MLDIKEISKSYGSIKALNNISLKISKGDIFGLLGPNGAGKSTLINILSCLIEPDNGSILLENKDIKNNFEEYKIQIGVVPQEIALYQELSAYENLLFWGSLYNISHQELQERVNHILNLFGLYERRKYKVKTYSGGMKRKINIACSILHNPSLLLMDEPTVGLDLQSRFHILELIENLNDSGVTIIYTTHNMEDAERLCNKIAVIDEGNILAKGNIDDLKELSGAKDTITIKLKNIYSLSLEKLTISQPSYNTDFKFNSLHVKCVNIDKELTYIINDIQNCGGEIISIETSAANLEGIFMKFTGKYLSK